MAFSFPKFSLARWHHTAGAGTTLLVLFEKSTDSDQDPTAIESAGTVVTSSWSELVMVAATGAKPLSQGEEAQRHCRWYRC
jgi:hypothetical protein